MPLAARSLTPWSSRALKPFVTPVGLELDFARAQTCPAQKAEADLGRKQQSLNNNEKES